MSYKASRLLHKIMYKLLPTLTSDEPKIAGFGNNPSLTQLAARPSQSIYSVVPL